MSIKLGLIAVTVLTAVGASRIVSPPTGRLFAAEPLTLEGWFTDGIEGPACDSAGNIFAVNFVRQGTIGRVTPEGRGEVYVTLPEGSIGNGLRFAADGTLLVADYTGHNILAVDPSTREVRVFAHEPAMNQPNDIALAPDGTIYASDPDWAAGTGRVWRVEAGGRVILAAAEMGTTNGLDVSPDGRRLYVNESVQRKVWAFSIAPDGSLREKRLIAGFPDFGLDGLRCDQDGNLYLARHGKGTIVKLSPAGAVLREIPVPGKRPSNLCFGGPDGRTVYVTEVDHGRLVRFRVDRPGREWGRP